MTIIIDAPRAIELMEQAVQEMGRDYVYPNHEDGCFYTINNQPSCLVGMALAKAGVPIEDLTDWNDRGTIGDAVLDSVPLDGFDFDPSAVAVFYEAQRFQDTGRPWGWALDRAKALALQYDESVLA